MQKITKCRLCNHGNLEEVIDLGHHPLADTFLPIGSVDEEIFYPLVLGRCLDCGHVSTVYPVSRVDRYQKHEYSYDSSNSAVSITHFRELSEAVIATIKPEKDAFIVDIGSNVGTLLSHFQSAGFENVIGVEPSGNIAEIANQSGVKTINLFFDDEAADEISRVGKVDIFLSTNVVNHTDDLSAILVLIKNLLKEEGIFVFEVPYLAELISRSAFDTIYHEHVHYISIKPLLAFLNRHGMTIFKLEELDYMCGSVRVYVKSGVEIEASVQEVVRKEESLGLFRTSTYKEFMERVRKVKVDINQYLWNAKARGGKIIGIGAATKGNTLLNYCRIDKDLISFISDSSSLKIGKQTPGSHIPICDDGDITGDVTHALILPWNIAPFLKKKLSHLKVTFYTPQVESLKNRG